MSDVSGVVLALVSFLCVPDRVEVGKIECFGERQILWVNANDEDFRECERKKATVFHYHECVVTHNVPGSVPGGRYADYRPQLYELSKRVRPYGLFEK